MVRLEPRVLLGQMELQDRPGLRALLARMVLLEARAQQALLDHKALLVLPESLADRDQRGQPELLALMVLQELLA
jgi:hypothetical protein